MISQYAVNLAGDVLMFCGHRRRHVIDFAVDDLATKIIREILVILVGVRGLLRLNTAGHSGLRKLDFGKL